MVVTELCPDPWDPDSVARWFVGRATRLGLRPNSTWAPVTNEKVLFGILGTFRTVVGPEVPAWRFQEGSPLVKTETSIPVLGRFQDTMTVGGTRLDAFVTITGTAPWGLHDTALADMAELLGLPEWYGDAQA
jgi:hypothetical protein